MKRKVIKYAIISISLIVLIICGYQVFKSFNHKTFPNVEKLIEEKKKKNYSDKDDNKYKVEDYVNTLPESRREYNNDDIIGRIEIPNLNINTLVVRTSNNVYYLNNNLYKQKDDKGTVFFDYRNRDLVNDKQINLYGHNTEYEPYLDKLPFVNLEAYNDKNIFDNYKDIYLSLDEKQVHYQVIAVKIVNNSDNEHMKVIFYSDEDFLNHTKKLLTNTLYIEDNLKISKDDRLIVLQACHYNPRNSYILIIGKEVK